jgi:transposase
MLAEGLKVKNFKKSIKNNGAKTDKADCLTLIEYGKYFILLKETMKNIIENNKELKTIYDNLTNQKGIKDEISLFLIVKLKELGKIQRKQLSSICGLAPIPFESGSSVKGHRYTRGGRKDIKSKLYFCVLSMIRYNTQFKNK